MQHQRERERESRHSFIRISNFATLISFESSVVSGVIIEITLRKNMISSARQDKYYSYIYIYISFSLSIFISLVTLREGMGKSFIPRRASRDHDILPRPPRPRSRAIHPDFSRVNTPFPLDECFFFSIPFFFSIRRCPVNLRGISRGLSILCNKYFQHQTLHMAWKLCKSRSSLSVTCE